MPPFKKKTATLVTEVQSTLAATTDHLAKLRRARQAAVLADDSAAIDRLDSDISAATKAAERAAERLKLLEADQKSPRPAHS